MIPSIHAVTTILYGNTIKYFVLKSLTVFLSHMCAFEEYVHPVTMALLLL